MGNDSARNYLDTLLSEIITGEKKIKYQSFKISGFILRACGQ